jgi:hypothetical protein
MPSGGKRKGAGRKAGALSKKTREVAERAIQEGITPLEVMIKAMHEYFAKGDWARAAAIAKDVAPYMHPRLSSIEHSGKDGAPVQFERIERVIVDPRNS